MGEFLSTLPGDIPGLLRRGSPVLTERGRIRGVFILQRADGAYDVAYAQTATCSGPFGAVVASDVPPALDLTDPTGRCHAAWWAQTHYTRQAPDVLAVYLLARSGADMTPGEIDTLARLVLRLAGRAS